MSEETSDDAAAKPEGTATPKPRKPKSAKGTVGEFFTVDRRTWHRVCGLGSMNVSVAYLVLAKGTGRDNRHTAWSVNAVETYGGIPRDKAKAAIEVLIGDGTVVRTQGGTRPRYELPAWHELRHRTELTPEERAVFDRVAAGESRPEFPPGRNTYEWRTARERHNAARASACQKGWLAYSNGGVYSVTPDPAATPDPVWLPNALVDGPGDGIPSVLARVRETQDPMALRLLVDLYSVHNLLSEGGIPRDVTYQKFEREKRGEHGVYVVYGFKPERLYVHRGPVSDAHRNDAKPDGYLSPNPCADFFRRMDLLKSASAIEWMPYLYESDTPDASPVHPYGQDHARVDPRTHPENAIGFAAHSAGTSLLQISQREKADDEWLVPVPEHMANVAMVGIARLRLKPYTRRTREWTGNLHEDARGYVAMYGRIGRGETSTVVRLPAPAVASPAARVGTL